MINHLNNKNKAYSINAWVIWQLASSASFRLKWFRDRNFMATFKDISNRNEALELLEMEHTEFQKLSENIDRELLKSVKFGTHPHSFNLNEINSNKKNSTPAMKNDYLSALWTAMTDSEFRRKCFGSPRKTIKEYGFELSEDELGKFRWFDEEKLAAFAEKIEALSKQKEASDPTIKKEDTQVVSDPYKKFYTQYCHEINVIREKGVSLSKKEDKINADEFDPGPPAPDFVSFMNTLQSIRVHGSNINNILLDTGWSIGRVLMLFNLMNRLSMKLPATDLSIVTNQSDCEKWFSDISIDSRPPLNEAYHQSPCSPNAVIGRVAHMLRHNWLSNRKVLVLGDDDGISVALAKYTDAEITVVDIDKEVLSFLGNLAKKADVKLRTVEHDLREELPADLIGRFDLVSADPPQNLHGEKFFLNRAIDALKDNIGTRIYTSVTPMWMGTEAYHGVLAHMTRMGFSPREILKGQMTFNVRHPFDPINEENKASRLLESILADTINMACDVHVFQKMHLYPGI